jgi:hypothetical protein
MWDSENDKKLTEAAENIQPALDESAWQKMEKMLDENLPQKKERKRFFFFLPFILILAGFLSFIFFYKNENRNIQQPNVPANSSAKSYALKEKPGREKATGSLKPAKSNEKAFASTENDIQKNKIIITGENKKAANNFVSNQVQNKNSDPNVSSEEAPSKTLNSDKIVEDSKPTNLSNSVSTNKTDAEINNTRVEEKQQEEKTILAVTDETKENRPDQKNAKQKEKKENGFADNFSVSFSTGPSVSSVGTHEGKLALDFGIGAGYRFSKHFGVRTGLYISKKIYSATPGEYTLPGGSTYNYLEKINANCKVIDIPLNVDYYFDQKGKHNWLVSAGLSSYLMKKESYDYVYKTPTGQIYNKNWTIANKNKHFFSVLDISVGYQYLFNKQFSLAAQPYVDLPLTGIGAGKVKLNSAGILFTVKAKPFQKKSK